MGANMYVNSEAREIAQELSITGSFAHFWEVPPALTPRVNEQPLSEAKRVQKGKDRS